MNFRGAAAVALKSELKVPLVFDLFILLQAFYLNCFPLNSIRGKARPNLLLFH